MSLRPLLIGGLFASLALNVFIGGAFLGSHLKKAQPTQSQAGVVGTGPHNPIQAAVRALPPERRAAWRAETPAYAQAYGPKVREARRLVRETMIGFGAEPFDPDAALRDLARARELEQEGRMAMDRRLVTFAATLPQPERAAFGAALARPRLGRGGGAEDGHRVALPNR